MAGVAGPSDTPLTLLIKHNKINKKKLYIYIYIYIYIQREREREREGSKLPTLQ